MANALAMLIAVIMDKWAHLIPGGSVAAQKRSSSWVSKYTTKVIALTNNTMVNKQGYLVALALIAPLCVVVLLLQFIFWKIFGSIVSLLFTAALLFYFLGSNAADQQSSEFVSAHERSFGIVFWFAILSPLKLGLVGALLYWFLVLSKQVPAINDQAKVQNALMWLHAMLAWIPARITGFIYALVGNFTSGFNCWLNCMRTPTMASGQVLQECGKAATDSSVSNDGHELVNRSYIAWAVLGILIILYL